MASTSNKPERRPRRKPVARLSPDIDVVVAAALDKKAEDVIVLDLRAGTAFTDAFVICTATNARQMQAISDGIEDALKKIGQRPALVEGYDNAEWILLDYFDFIVHIFTPTTRILYDLERLWGDAKRVAVSAK